MQRGRQGLFRTASAIALLAMGRGVTGQDVSVPTVKIAVIEEVDVPARRAGTLVALDVREGSRVAAEEEIGRVDDAAALLAEKRARLLLDVARKTAESDAPVELARKALAEARAAVGRAELKLAVVQRTAGNDLAVRSAESALLEARAGVAKWQKEVEIAAKKAESVVDEQIARATAVGAAAELTRAEATRRTIGDAVSLSEVEKLRLERDLANLEVTRAAELQDVAEMTRTLKEAEKTAGEAAAVSAELAVEQAKFDHALEALAVEAEELNVESAKLAVDTADVKLAQARHEAELVALNAAVAEADVEVAGEALAGHAVVSPVAGIVVERYKPRGTWVQPGDSVVRVLRLDRLRAEAFVDALTVDMSTVGAPVLVTVPTKAGPRQLQGEVVYVSPEVDTVDGQVLVWAEFDNPNFEVLPGTRGSMLIRPDARLGRNER